MLCQNSDRSVPEKSLHSMTQGLVVLLQLEYIHDIWKIKGPKVLAGALISALELLVLGSGQVSEFWSLA